jgi:hypothetical protein
MTSKKLTQLELVLLQLIQKGQGKWSWYELANEYCIIKIQNIEFTPF